MIVEGLSTKDTWPFTLHSSSFTHHTSPFILHPSPFILHPSPFILHPSPFILHHSSFILEGKWLRVKHEGWMVKGLVGFSMKDTWPFTPHPSPFTLCTSPLIPHTSPYILHPSPFILHLSPFILEGYWWRVKHKVWMVNGLVWKILDPIDLKWLLPLVGTINNIFAGVCLTPVTSEMTLSDMHWLTPLEKNIRYTWGHIGETIGDVLGCKLYCPSWAPIITSLQVSAWHLWNLKWP